MIAKALHRGGKNNPNVPDVSNPSKGLKEGRIFEISGQKEIRINSMADIISICKIVEATRVAKSHDLNDRSSRSHCIVPIVMTKKL